MTCARAQKMEEFIIKKCVKNEITFRGEEYRNL